MTPNRIIPDLQCSLLCEDIRQEVSGNLILVGVINVIRVPQVPITAARLLIMNRWCAGVGQFTETIRVIAPDGTVVRKNSSKFQLGDPTQVAVLANVFGNLEFPAAGVYHVEVLVDEVMKLRYPGPVVVVQQPPGGAPTA
jgi:hypothetical protein